METGKAKPKFSTEFLGETFETDLRLDQIINWCNQFHSHGLAPSYGEGSFGNLSYRVNAGSKDFIITGSALELKEHLTKDEFVKVVAVDSNNLRIQAFGKRVPSSETMLHAAIYEARPEVNAIFHGHCEIVLKNAEQAGIQTTEKEEEYGTNSLVSSVLSILMNRYFLVMKGHGFLSLGKSLEEAGEAAINVLGRCQQF